MGENDWFGFVFLGEWAVLALAVVGLVALLGAACYAAYAILGAFKHREGD